MEGVKKVFCGLVLICVLTIVLFIFRLNIQDHIFSFRSLKNNNHDDRGLFGQVADLVDALSKKIKNRPTQSSSLKMSPLGGWLSSFFDKNECPESLFVANQSKGCVIPEIDPFHPSIMKYSRKTPYPNCPGVTYGTLAHGKLNFTDSSVVSATYRAILRDGDFRSKLGTLKTVGTNLIKDELIEVFYTLKTGRVVKDYLYQVLRRRSLVRRKARKSPGIPLNILIVGMDSLSLGNAQRSMPILYKYIKEDLQGLIFKGHAIVGDGTTPQMTAMLTGKHVEEQYPALRGKPGSKPLDGWNWIFKDLKEYGYLTGFSEDGVHEGPFQYRLTGFSNPPTDFYPRPYFLHVGSKATTKTDRCINNRNINQIHVNYVRAVFDAFPRKLKFFSSFSAAYSHHEMNDATKNERDVMLLIKYLRGKGYLKNTLLIAMGDHGLRFGKVRAEIQGKLEERLPFFSMVFPTAFREKYPGLMKILETNTNRLTTWFDLHATFLHMLSYPALPKNLTHGVSLFTEVPENRTCAEAGLSNHWCPCLQWEAVDVKHVHIQKAGAAVVEYMNALLREYNASANACHNLTLKVVNYAQIERLNKDVRKVHQDSSSKQSREYFCRYQLQFVTLPNQGVFEATVKYYQTRFIVNAGISRINEYGDQPKCVADQLPHVRKYCLCRNYNGTL